MYSFHQVHKSIYYNDKQLSKNYIEWDEVKKNFKDFFNANLLDKMSNEKEFKDLGELGILVTGLASKFVDYAIDTYINPEGLSLLIQKSDKKSEIPEPNLATLILELFRKSIPSLDKTTCVSIVSMAFCDADASELAAEALALAPAAKFEA